MFSLSETKLNHVPSNNESSLPRALTVLIDGTVRCSKKQNTLPQICSSPQISSDRNAISVSRQRNFYSSRRTVEIRDDHSNQQQGTDQLSNIVSAMQSLLSSAPSAATVVGNQRSGPDSLGREHSLKEELSETADFFECSHSAM